MHSVKPITAYCQTQWTALCETCAILKDFLVSAKRWLAPNEFCYRKIEQLIPITNCCLTTAIKCLCHASWCVKSQIIEHSCMFIVTIIAQLGVFLATWSQLASAHLHKSRFDNGQLQDFKVSLSWVKYPGNCLSDRNYWIGTRRIFFLNTLTAISRSTFNLSTKASNLQYPLI